MLPYHWYDLLEVEYPNCMQMAHNFQQNHGRATLNRGPKSYQRFPIQHDQCYFLVFKLDIQVISNPDKIGYLEFHHVCLGHNGSVLFMMNTTDCCWYRISTKRPTNIINIHWTNQHLPTNILGQHNAYVPTSKHWLLAQVNSRWKSSCRTLSGRPWTVVSWRHLRRSRSKLSS